jgi:hypothetical protein
MAFLGDGVLVIWNDITAEAETEFLAWHVLQHIPERVSIPGFIRGQRYVALDGAPKYFNFYETRDVSVLTSPAYCDRLNNPTEWTRAIVRHFRNTSRTITRRVASAGHGDGVFIETIKLKAGSDTPTFPRAFAEEVLPALCESRGIVGAHLLEGVGEASRLASAEKAIRNEPDQIADWVVMIEAIEAEHLHAMRRGAASERAFPGCGIARGSERGIYRLQFALSKQELEKNPVSGERRWRD